MLKIRKMEKVKNSATFLFLRKIGIIHDETKYGNISVLGVLKHIIKTIRIAYLFRKSYSPGLFHTRDFNSRRAKIWRKMGCHIGNGVCIGHSVALDIGNTDLIHIEDGVIITNHCTILCHRRDLSGYQMGDDSSKLPYIYAPVILKKGCQIGMGSMIMPGVTIGEGAIIGAHSVVTKDIPAWTVAVGNPCKVIKQL